MRVSLPVPVLLPVLSLLLYMTMATPARAGAPAVRCLDLPASPRHSLTVADDGRVMWVEGEALVGLDPATEVPRVLASGVRAAAFFGEGLVVMRGEALHLPDGRVLPVVPEAGAFAVDPAGPVLYVMAPGDKGRRLDALRPGAEPQPMATGVTSFAVVPGGGVVVEAMASTAGGRTYALVHVAPDGTRTTLVESKGRTSAFAATSHHVLYVADGQLLSQPLSGARGKPVSLGAASGLLGAGSGPAVTFRGVQRLLVTLETPRTRAYPDWADQVTTLATVGAEGTTRRFTRVVGGKVRDAELLADGATAVALVEYDTYAEDATRYTPDEADVCFFAATAADWPLPLPTRTHPKGQYAAALAKLERLATGDLAAAKVRFERARPGPTIVFDVPGAGPETLDALAARGRAIFVAAAPILQDGALGLPPQTSLLVIWRDNGRSAGMRWEPTIGRFMPVAGGYGHVVWPRKLFRVAAARKTRVASDAYGMDATTSCVGDVTNLEEAPVDITVTCQGWKDYGRQGAPDLEASATLRAVAPGATQPYKIVLGQSRFKLAQVDTRFTVGGDDLSPYDDNAYRELEDLLATIDRIVAATAFVLDVAPSAWLDARIGYAHPTALRWRADQLFAVPRAEQRKVAALVGKELLGHYQRTHSSDERKEVTTHLVAPDDREIVVVNGRVR